MVIVKVTLLWIVAIATRWLDTPKFKKTILENFFYQLKVPVVIKFVRNVQF